MPDCGACPIESYRLGFDKLRDDSGRALHRSGECSTWNTFPERCTLRARVEDTACGIATAAFLGKQKSRFLFRPINRPTSEPVLNRVVPGQCSTWNTWGRTYP